MARMIRAVLVGALAMIVLGAGIVAALAYLPSLAPQRRVAIEPEAQRDEGGRPFVVDDVDVLVDGYARRDGDVAHVAGTVSLVRSGDLTAAVGECGVDGVLDTLECRGPG